MYLYLYLCICICLCSGVYCVEGSKICINLSAIVFLCVFVIVHLYLSLHCCVLCGRHQDKHLFFAIVFVCVLVFLCVRVFVHLYLSQHLCVLCGRKQDL